MRNELVYQITMACAAWMMEKTLITRQQYRDFEQLMLEKYTPEIGGLFSSIDLL